MMTFDDLLDHVRQLLQNKGRISYRALKRRFELDEEYLEDLKVELIKAEGVAVDENGEVLVWVGTSPVQSSEFKVQSSPPASSQISDSRLRTLNSELTTAERRQLTVMFCDLVGSTALSAQLDPEELREVIRGYQQTSAAIIERYSGYVAQYLGDGLLVYFGYPLAHEDDAARAVRAGLEILTALQDFSLRHKVPFPLRGEKELQRLHVRIGIHTGLVVVGEMGAGSRQEQLALGETPNIAARIQAMASPDEVVISAVTHRLVVGLFECQELGSQTLKGVTAPVVLYRVLREAEAQSRFEAAVRTGLTPLIGRAEELALLCRRWEQAKEGEGQVVLLSGEAGIGKSRLVQEMKERVGREGATCIEFRCSPYHQNSAFYPILTHLQRLLQFAPGDPPQTKLRKLQKTLARYRVSQAETLPLLAALLSLPPPDHYPPLTWSPQKQKEKTQEALVAWLLEETARQVVYLVWEDLHWLDPSSLEVLTLILQQVPTTRVLVILTYRPDFTPPWRSRTRSTQLMLSRLGQQHVTAMVYQVMAKAVLADETIQQIVSRTDGVPLFVEELTKVVLDAEGGGARHAVPLPVLGIPTTLQDALMARLDRLGAAKTIAQLGATLGREFSSALLQAVAPVDATALQQALQQLVDAELLYQRGLPPQTTYQFKHALIQDAAYQSLLKNTRQQYHKQIAQALEENFSGAKESQPELLAHHYTEAGLIAQALPYWQQAGQRAVQRWANAEAISHLTRGLELIKRLPDTSGRAQQELALQTALGPVLIAAKGYTAPEVEHTYTRARTLCQQVGETPGLFSILWGLFLFYLVRAEFQQGRELGKQLYNLAQGIQDPVLLLEARLAMGSLLFHLGELTPAREHLEQGISLYNLQQHRSLVFLYGTDPGVHCLSYASWVLWVLGYPDQALKRSQEALTLAHELAHPFMRAFSLDYAATLHQFRRERQAVQERAVAAMKLCAEQRFVYYLTCESVLQGWALADQGQGEEGVMQIRQAVATFRAMGAEIRQPLYLALLAEAHGTVGQAQEGLSAVSEALILGNATGQCWYEAELYRLKGELMVKQFGVWSSEFGLSNPQHPKSSPQAEAEACFQKAIEVAQKQQAKSLELRASTSLARLWQQQGKKAEAAQLLAEIYGWFTEGFDTKDLQEAKMLLEELT